MLSRRPFTRNFELHDFQRKALDAFIHAVRTGAAGGCIEMFTGSGKTLVALMCMQWLLLHGRHPDLQFVITAPSVDLARQWILRLSRFTSIPPSRVGLYGAGGKDTLEDKDVLVMVLRSAGVHLERLVRASGRPVMLVVDECHNSGAPRAQRIYDAPTVFRLGLSASPVREGEVDEHGKVLPFEQQPHGRMLGSIIHRLDLKSGRAHGLLPPYRIFYDALTLDRQESWEYRMNTRSIRNKYKRLQALLGKRVPAERLVQYTGYAAPIGPLAADLNKAILARRQQLFQCCERARIALAILASELTDKEGEARKVQFFHERVEEARKLHELLRAEAAAGRLPLCPDQIGLHHGTLHPHEKQRVLDGFRGRAIRVLVSVKALQEGIDVSDIDVAIIVASTSSMRQRLQTLGRALRWPRDAQGNRIPRALCREKHLYVLYAEDTVDEKVFDKTDWGELAGRAVSEWRRWDQGAEHPVADRERLPGGRSVQVEELPTQAPDVASAAETADALVTTVRTAHPAPHRSMRPRRIGVTIPVRGTWPEVFRAACRAAAQNDDDSVKLAARALASRRRMRPQRRAALLNVLVQEGGCSRGSHSGSHPLVRRAFRAWRKRDLETVRAIRTVLERSGKHHFATALGELVGNAKLAA